MGNSETDGPRIFLTPVKWLSNYPVTLLTKPSHWLILKSSQQRAPMEPTSPQALIRATPIALLALSSMKFGFADFLL